ncbi:hypothetical protein ASPSYDRAFT_50820 [Aspergillus sydowii CBS 593.65]|uniref:Uncharacterized protein n=1 Tax=Aspergillus sydowii CBS 593.65 TaxID=1036612 RepID=A0A1L9T1Z0_9EURO|nr:uncharacterized protein ASPSYDRAFT_50820 [Aspergillus sydowii CBS 593.65]OJJ53313.1 hypothetical protein ASPSYDRAFT_50820 [Aspergillus sydowii CBS 593.65]
MGMRRPCGLPSLVYSVITSIKISTKNKDMKGFSVSVEGAESAGDAEYHLILLSDPSPPHPHQPA